MQNRRSARLDKNPLYKSGYAKKHLVCVLNANLMENAINWVTNKNNEFADYQKKVLKINLTPAEIKALPYYQLMDFQDLKVKDSKLSSSDKFANVDNDTILYLFCHGYTNNMTDPDLAIQLNIKGSKTPVVDFTPQEFLAFLKGHQLSKNHKVLKLAVCYSEDFVRELSDISRDCFTDMIIAGYFAELIVNQKNNHKYAGLLPGSGYTTMTERDILPIFNKGLIEGSTEMMEFYRARNWRYTYQNGELLEGARFAGLTDEKGFTPIPLRKQKKRLLSHNIITKQLRAEAKNDDEDKKEFKETKKIKAGLIPSVSSPVGVASLSFLNQLTQKSVTPIKPAGKEEKKFSHSISS